MKLLGFAGEGSVINPTYHQSADRIADTRKCIWYRLADKRIMKLLDFARLITDYQENHLSRVIRIKDLPPPTSPKFKFNLGEENGQRILFKHGG